jgi:organic radical activating enzyme
MKDIKQKKHIIKTLSKYISNTKTFCVLPWIHLATDNQGHYKLCCAAQFPITTNNGYNTRHIHSTGKKVHTTVNPINEIWNNTYMKNVRKKMLNGEQIEACQFCYKEEKQQKLISYRERKNITEILDEQRGDIIKQRVLDTLPDGSLKDLPYIIDLTIDSRCNLTCAMCTSSDSSGVETFIRTQIKNGNRNKFDDHTLHQFDTVNELPDDKKMWSEHQFFIDNIETLGPIMKELYATGGEPFLVKSLWKIYDKFIEKGYSKNIKLSYCSNLTAITKPQLDIINKFKQCTISASIDGYGDEYNFTRWPSTWEKIDFTVQNMIKNWVNEKNYLHFTYVYTILTIFSLPQFCNWITFYTNKLINKWEENGQTRIRCIPDTTLNQADRPDYLNIEYLHKEAIDYIINYLECNKKQCNFIDIPKQTIKLETEYENIITMLKNAKKKKNWKYKKDFLNFIEMREEYIGLKINDFLPKEFQRILYAG